jgi:hypothetical protein
VYHTADGGTTWSLITGLPYTGAPAGSAYPGGCWSEYATDFAVGPADAQTGQPTLIAVFGRVSDAACANPTTGSRRNNGIYRSVDGGATWVKIGASGANGFPAIPGTVGRIALLLAPSNPKHAYALIENNSNGNSLGIFTTQDITAATVAWAAGSTTNYASAQGWYDMTGSVDPTNENRLMVGGLDNYLSTDGGATLTKVSGWSATDATWSHADHHHAIFVDANTYYDANDGGFFIGTLNGSSVTWAHKNAGSLSTLQFYGLGQSATAPYKINAGLQDNGHAYLDGTRWRETYGGDGGFSCVDQTSDLNAYEEYVYGAIRHSGDGGNSWPLQDCMGSFGTTNPCGPNCNLVTACVPDNHTAFIAWYTLDVHNQSVMYVGSNWLYRNLLAPQAGKVWQRITTDGVNGDFVSGAASSRAYISHIHIPQASPVDSVTGFSQVIYVGTSTGRIWKTTNGGLAWADLTKAPLPVDSTTTGRFLTSIDTDPADANKVVVSYSGWSNTTLTVMPGHVFRSLDGGASWADISGALPDEPFNSVAVNPNTGETNEIYAASDTGVYVNTNGWSGNTWIRSNSGLLPYVSVNMLQFTRATTPRRLRAASHGRGIWELFKQCAATISLDKPVYACNDTITITLQDNSLGAGSQKVLVTSRAEPKGETVTLVETPAVSGHFVGNIPLTGGSAIQGDGKLTVFNADQVSVLYVDATPCPNTSANITASSGVDCNNCATPTGSSGGNIQLDPASVTTSIQGGDGDEFLDNCETGVVTFTVKNDGAAGLTNVRISNVTPSNPGVRVGPLPVAVASKLAVCSTAPARFSVTAGGLSPGENLDLKVDVTSNELAAAGIVRSLTVRFANCEQDWTFYPSRTFSFETGDEGWEKVSGIFDRTNTGGGANLTSWYIASSSLQDNACDEIHSPIFKMTPTSTLSLYNQYSTEPKDISTIPPDPSNPTAMAWFDRANAGIFDVANGTRTPVVPSGGRTYSASGPNGTCVSAGEPGWAGAGPGWMQSTWTAADLNAPAIAGRKVRLDIGYGTDGSVSGTGFWFDEVTLANVYVLGPDRQSDVCPVDLDDSDPAIEYTGGWHRVSNPSASNGGYHVRVGSNPRGAAARLVFQGSAITYFYAVSIQGGTADIYLDGALKQTLSYSGAGAITFGASLTYSGLASGSHELRIVHRSGAVYVDGFRIVGGSANASAVQYTSQQQDSTGTAAEGAVLLRTVQVAAGDVDISVLVDGSSAPLTVKLLDPTGLVIGSGGALLSGFSSSGLDSLVTTPGIYTVQVLGLSLSDSITISIVRDSKIP